ncbi:MAG: hypothetical protein CMH94_01210 [Oceanicaulis sp.]|nr:hypothetical protein [Maricaulis sp.]MBI74208.1 hypothetical protein [Oceanicaulis sp.]|tara:strand:+ start:183 stop:395 length:213 start_codon:yes stop_codon:yes gene_type:complete
MRWFFVVIGFFAALCIWVFGGYVLIFEENMAGVLFAFLGVFIAFSTVLFFPNDLRERFFRLFFRGPFGVD